MSKFKPMLAASTVPGLDGIKYPVLASPKLDGIRCLIIDGQAVSRNLKAIPNRHVRDTLSTLDLDHLDGELMVDGDFNSVQSAIMSVAGKPKFYYNVFDSFENPEARFSHRVIRAKLHAQGVDSPYVRYVPQVWVDNAEQLAELWSEWLEEGYEGAIVRDPSAPYKFGRSTLNQGWMLKLKKFDDTEAEIVDMEELMHNENAADVGELGQTKRSHEQAGMVPGNTLGAFVCHLNTRRGTVEFKLGTGFTSAQRHEYWHDLSSVGKLAKFKFQGFGPKGKPRFPVFLGFRSRDDV